MVCHGIQKEDFVLKISGYIITKNNERSLQWALESVYKRLDEIIIVDSGSTDRTIEIASQYTDKIYFNEFKNFADQRNHAIGRCSGDWIFTMDADEVMGANFHYLFKFFNKNFKAILIPRYNLVSLDPTAFIVKPHYSDWQVRMFRNDGQIHYDPEHKIHHQLLNCRPRFKLPFVNIFHLHWLMYAYADRKKRVEYYENMDAGSGFPRYYLYEDYPYAIAKTMEQITPDIMKLIKQDTNMQHYENNISPVVQFKHEVDYYSKSTIAYMRDFMGV